jgi:anti-anti-sigma factor
VAEPNFILEGPKLTVNCDLQAGFEDDLRKACEQLLRSSEVTLAIDLSAVKYIHSLSVGMLSYAWVEALSQDKEMNFLVSKEVADVFERTGLAKVFDCDVQD